MVPIRVVVVKSWVHPCSGGVCIPVPVPPGFNNGYGFSFWLFAVRFSARSV